MDRINEEKIMQVLKSCNTWWHMYNIPAEKTFPKNRNAFYEAVNKLNQAKKYIYISGQRRVGKTVVMHQIVQHLLKQGVPECNILYIPFFHPLFRALTPDAVLRVYRDYIYSGNDEYYFFDDVQLSLSFDEWISAVNIKKTGAHIVACGTFMPETLMNDRTEESVPREDIYMPPLSFYEYCSLFAENDMVTLPPKLTPQDLVETSKQVQKNLYIALSPLRKHFAKYLQIGGYPGRCNGTETPHDLRTAVNFALYQDIYTVFKTRNVADLEKILMFLCFQTSPLASFDFMSNAIDTLSRPTIEKYVRMLECAGLVAVSNPMSISGELLQKSRPKIYVIDGALKNSLVVNERHNIGQSFMNYSTEAAAFRQLKHMTKNAGQMSIGYYRTSGAKGKVIDIVVNGPKGNVFIDIRYLDDYEFNHSEPIWAYQNESKHAFVLTKREDDFGSFPNGPEKLYRIPAHAYLYVLGNVEKEEIIG